MIYDILCEPDYFNNNRTKRILKEVEFYASKRKSSVNYYFKVDDLPKKCNLIIVLSASDIWTEKTIKYLQMLNIHPIIYGMQLIRSEKPISSVTINYFQTFLNITNQVIFSKNNSDKKIAFVGYNIDSYPDKQKYDGFKYVINNLKVPSEVFYNYGNIQDCIDRFIKKQDEFYGAVCVNDNVAILLLNNLTDKNDICVSGFGGLLIRDYFPKKFISADVNYKEIGYCIASLYTFLFKLKIKNSVNIEIGCVNELPSKTDYNLNKVNNNQNIIDFYGESSIAEIDNIESMLLSCDKIDINILSKILFGNTYEKIAETENLAINSIKYRINKMMDNLDVVKRKEMIKVLQKYNLNF